MRALFLSLALVGCADGCATVADQPDQADLGRELAGMVAGHPQSCIPWRSSQALQATESGQLVYRAGDTIWVNRPFVRCRGLRPTDTLVVEMRGGSRYCRGDRVRAVEASATVAGPQCVLGDFTPYRRAR